MVTGLNSLATRFLYFLLPSAPHQSFAVKRWALSILKRREDLLSTLGPGKGLWVLVLCLYSVSNSLN